jgi:hypothetical protein
MLLAGDDDNVLSHGGLSGPRGRPQLAWKLICIPDWKFLAAVIRS